MLASRFRAQLLAGRPARDCVKVVERLLAVQGQDPRGFRLTVRARTRGLTAADVDAALNDRRLVVTWLNRGTLHLVRPEDYPWLQSLTAPGHASTSARRLAQEGVTPDAAERGVAIIERVLAHGPATRQQLRDKIAAAGVRVEGQALVHLLWLASLRGVTVRGPMVGDEQAFVLVRDWLGPTPEIDRDTALAELARRYLVGHGPATEHDLVRWSGLPLRDCRRGIAQTRVVALDGGLVDVPRRTSSSALPPPKLLGAFDPVLLGWTSRTPIIDGHEGIVTSNGVFRPFALVGGKAVATWGLVRGRVELRTQFGELSNEDRAALTRDASDVERFFAVA